MKAPHDFPQLYKKTNTGAVNCWRVRVEGSTIVVVYGQVGGAFQSTSDVVRKGKNLGKKNETTPEQQAVLEAEAKWRKKQEREGYVQDINRAEAGETDTEGGIAPMLAQPLKDAKHRFKFPCDAQRKYNGVRCIAVVDANVCTLWSRKRTLITGVPHINAAYEHAYCGVNEGRFIFDGELYQHGKSLQVLSGFARSKTPKDGYSELSHNVYDLPSHAGSWVERREAIKNEFLSGLNQVGPAIKMVQTVPVYDGLVTAKKLHDAWVEEGYEGVILRDHQGRYEAGKRSYHLVKMKEFEEAEFQIIDVGEGRGRMAGKAVFMCRTPNEKEFECVAPGTMEDKARFLHRRSELIGKMLTVKYFDTTDGGVPSHGVGVAVRDYE
jgi:DNA ligase 1